MPQKNKVVKKIVIPDKSLPEDEGFIIYPVEKNVKSKKTSVNKDDRFRAVLALSSVRRKNKKQKVKLNMDMERGL